MGALGLNGCDGEGLPWTYHFTDNTRNIPPGGMSVKGFRLGRNLGLFRFGGSLRGPVVAGRGLILASVVHGFLVTVGGRLDLEGGVFDADFEVFGDAALQVGQDGGCVPVLHAGVLDGDVG
jgi:hypothetical protein